MNQMILGPLKETQEGTLKELAKERKKMESRRLDYDYKVEAARSFVLELLSDGL